MSQPCTICQHPRRAAIDAVLRRPGALPLRAIAALAGDVSKDALLRHQQNHLAKDPEPAPEMRPRERTAYDEEVATRLEASRARPRFEPVKWAGREEPDDQPVTEPKGEWWTIRGKRYFVPDSDAARAPRIDHVIKRGVQYVRPRPRCYLTWED